MGISFVVKSFLSNNHNSKCSSECFWYVEKPCSLQIEYWLQPSFRSVSENRLSFKKFQCLCGRALKYLTLIVTTEECTWGILEFFGPSPEHFGPTFGAISVKCEILKYSNISPIENTYTEKIPGSIPLYSKHDQKLIPMWILTGESLNFTLYILFLYDLIHRNEALNIWPWNRFAPYFFFISRIILYVSWSLKM